MQRKYIIRTISGVLTALIVTACFAAINDHFQIRTLKNKTKKLESKYSEVSQDIKDTKTVVCLIGIRLSADSETLEDICTNY